MRITTHATKAAQAIVKLIGKATRREIYLEDRIAIAEHIQSAIDARENSRSAMRLSAMERLILEPRVREVYLSPLRYSATDERIAQYQCELALDGGESQAFQRDTLGEAINSALLWVAANKQITDHGHD